MKNIHFVLPLLLIAITSNISNAAPSTSGYEQSQVDGITGRVVDELWGRTDYWWHSGDYPRIIGDDRIITEADPGFLEPYSTGGWLMESMGDNVDAEKYYLLGANRNPTKSYIWYNLGFFYFNTLKDYPKAIATFSADVKTPDAGINDWKMLAHSYEKNHQYDKAVAVWQKLHQVFGTDPVVIHNLQKDENILVSLVQPTPEHS